MSGDHEGVFSFYAEVLENPFVGSGMGFEFFDAFNAEAFFEEGGQAGVFQLGLHSGLGGIGEAGESEAVFLQGLESWDDIGVGRQGAHRFCDGLLGGVGCEIDALGFGDHEEGGGANFAEGVGVIGEGFHQRVVKHLGKPQGHQFFASFESVGD